MKPAPGLARGMKNGKRGATTIVIGTNASLQIARANRLGYTICMCKANEK
jgi:hypothetical protein